METDQLRRLWKLAFGDSEVFIGIFFDTAYAPERCHRIDLSGQTAAALHWLDCSYRGQKLAYIYAVATHPAFRGGGLCRELMQKTHETLASRGYAGALLMPAESGLRQMYAKMGYRECCTVREFSCTAGAAVSIREIGPEEYTRLRRRYLPENGVLQEGESIAYLHTYARFYAGEDFLLAGAPDKDSFHGIELLGNPDAAPGILAALGYAEGTFRGPGPDIPFAMFHPLTENSPAPGYLGLAFD